MSNDPIWMNIGPTRQPDVAAVPKWTVFNCPDELAAELANEPDVAIAPRWTIRRAAFAHPVITERVRQRIADEVADFIIRTKIAKQKKTDWATEGF